MKHQDRSLRWGLLSTARINGALLHAGLRPYAVASRSLQRAKQYAEANNIPHPYGSYEELLDDPRVDAVYISLPNALHIPWAEKALQAGKHVLCEKPLGSDASAVMRTCELAKQRDLLFREAFMWQHLPQTTKLLELLDAQIFGTPKLIRASFSFQLINENDVRLQKSLEGGALRDLGCYGVHAARTISQREPTSGYAKYVYAESGVDLSCVALLHFGEALHAQIDCSFVMPSRERLEIICEAGTILLKDPWRGIEPKIYLFGTQGQKQIHAPRKDPYLAQIEAFEIDISSLSKHHTSRMDAIGQAKALELLARSSEL